MLHWLSRNDPLLDPEVHTAVPPNPPVQKIPTGILYCMSILNNSTFHGGHPDFLPLFRCAVRFLHLPHDW